MQAIQNLTPADIRLPRSRPWKIATMRELASVELREHFSLDQTTAWMVDYQCRASNSGSNLGWCHACSDRCHGTRSCTAPSSTSVQFKLYWYVTSSVCLQNNLGMCGSGHVRPRPRPMHNWATPPGLLLERSNSKNKSITVSNGTVNTTQQMPQPCSAVSFPGTQKSEGIPALAREVRWARGFQNEILDFDSD